MSEGQVIRDVDISETQTSTKNSRHKENDIVRNNKAIIHDLLGKPEFNSFVPLYTEAETQADKTISVIQQALEQVENAQLIPKIARANLDKQINRLLQGTDNIKQSKPATISRFGVYKTYTSVDELNEELKKVINDFTKTQENSTNYDSFKEKGIHTIDKYLFDSREIATNNKPITIQFFEYPQHPGIERLKKNPRIPQSVIEEISQKNRHRPFSEILEELEIVRTEEKLISPIAPNATIEIKKLPDMIYPKRAVEQGFSDSEEDYVREYSILHPDKNSPDIAVVHLPFAEYKTDNLYDLNQIWLDSVINFNDTNRPIIVFYADGFSSTLAQRSAYDGILWAETPDQLRNIIGMSQELKKLQKKDNVLHPSELAPLQQSQYDKSTDLREWEHITADTYQSLKHIISRIQYRENLWSEKNRNRGEQLTPYEISSVPDRKKIKTILDLGTGEGRIGGMLARLGFNVLGLDISTEMLKRAGERIIEEGKGLRGEKEDNSLSYPTIQTLKREGIIQEDILLNDNEVQKKYLLTQGNFFEIFSTLHNTVRNWKEHFPNIDIYKFFNIPTDNMYAFQNPYDMFTDAGFDMALFNWHTFCEIGDLDNQKKVLTNILNVLNPGGELIIEIPDRMVDPYASEIRKYHSEHPNEPYGIVIDSYPDDPTKKYSPRYFPDRTELVLLLESLGYEIDPIHDIQTYLLDTTNPETNKKKIELKELFITARKSSLFSTVNKLLS